MCNHYLSPDEAAMERAWHIGNRTPLKRPAEVVPRRTGLFLRAASRGPLDLVVGLWSLIPHWSKEPRLKFSTNNARSEEVAIKPSYKDAWRSGQAKAAGERPLDGGVRHLWAPGAPDAHSLEPERRTLGRTHPLLGQRLEQPWVWGRRVVPRRERSQGVPWP